MSNTKIPEVIQKLQDWPNQVYWVCPLVEGSEKSDLIAVKERFKKLQQVFEDKVEKCDLASTIEKQGVLCNFEYLKPFQIQNRLKAIANGYKVNIDNETVACYSRQITKYNNIEKYTRERNYPDKTFTVSKDDIEKLGLRTFFFSDASSAINRKVYKKLNGYDQKRLPISEDMYIAYKIIMNGYKIKYCAESEVYHSHKFTLKQIYDRYKLTGKFFKENSYLDEYGTTGSGADLAKYILKRIFQEHNFKMLFRYPFDMAARLFGMKAGKK